MICAWCRAGIHVGPKWVTTKTLLEHGLPIIGVLGGLGDRFNKEIQVDGCKGGTWCDCAHRPLREETT